MTRPAWQRLGVRLSGFILLLLLVDSLCQRAFGPALQQDFASHYRLPNDQELAYLPAYLSALEANKKQGLQQLLFLGSSPVYGVSIQDPAQTYPYAFARAFTALRPELKQLQVHNLGAKGLLASDMHYLLKRSLPLADAVAIQLNYHTFNPEFLAKTPIRHAILPDLLGVQVSWEEAAWLGMRPSPLLNFNATARHWLQRHWFFYREKERLAQLWLGKSPEQAFYELFFAAQASPETEDTPSAQPFYELPNARQLYVVQRYAQNVDFDLSPDNLELRFVSQMLAQLQAAQKPAVFFMAPINVEALDYFEVMDWQRYQRNTQQIRNLIEAAGYTLLDDNLSEPLAEEYFADISHTLDAGGAAYGERLAEQLSALWPKFSASSSPVP